MHKFDPSKRFTLSFTETEPQDVSVPTLKPYEQWNGVRIYKYFIPGTEEPRWLIGDEWFWTLRDARRHAQKMFFEACRALPVKRTKWSRHLDAVQENGHGRR